MRLNPFSRSKRRSTSSGVVSSSTKQAIAGVVLIVFSLIALLSFAAQAGPTGEFIFTTLRRMFGFVAYAVPFALIAVGIYLLRPHTQSLSRLHVIGIALISVGILGLFHIPGISPEDAYQVAIDGKGGGLIGFMLAYPMVRALSAIAAVLLFVGSLCVGVFLTFDITPGVVWGWIQSLAPGRTGEDEDSGEDEDEEEEQTSAPAQIFQIRRRRLTAEKPDADQLSLQQVQQRAREEEQKKRVEKQVRSANQKYKVPPLSILHSSIGKPDSGNVDVNKKKIQSALEKFGIDVTMGKVSVGPTVAQYTLRPEEGVKLSRITALQNDLALALAAHPIRIEAPIPNTNMVGIEIPNKDVSLVRLRDVISSKEFRKSQSPLTLALGKDVAGKPQVASIESMPHVLIAGATGSGKSIFINTLILSLLYRNSPSLVRLLLVDPKRVELSLYNGIPHLLVPVITEADKTVNALKWAIKEMDRRYRRLSEVGARNILSYNANNPEGALPYIVIVIDELADLMSTNGRDVEGMIVRLAQMARAVGIHLVLATQRPSVNVITGVIKANVPARVAFNVASQVDSRTILDTSGAEKLLGSGDMLYLPGDRARPTRLQGGFVSEEEVRQVVQNIKDNNPEEIEHDESITSPSRDTSSSGAEGVDDTLFEDARQVVVGSGKASASLLQRRLRVGYARAARILDMLEEHGVIGPQEGNKPREILQRNTEQYEEDSGTDEDSSRSEEQW